MLLRIALQHQWGFNRISPFSIVDDSESNLQATANDTLPQSSSNRVSTPPQSVEEAASGLIFAPEASFLDCLTVPSTGAKLQWEVIVNGQLSAPPTSSTRPPRVTRISGYSVADSRTEGRTAFRIEGQDFGPVGLSFPSIQVT